MTNQTTSMDALHKVIWVRGHGTLTSGHVKPVESQRFPMAFHPFPWDEKLKNWWSAAIDLRKAAAVF